MSSFRTASFIAEIFTSIVKRRNHSTCFVRLRHSTGYSFFPVPSSSKLIALVGQILAASMIFSSLSPLGSITSAIIFASSLNTFGVACIHLVYFFFLVLLFVIFFFISVIYFYFCTYFLVLT